MTGKIFGTRRRLLMGIGGTVGLATIGGDAAICLASDRLIRTFKGHSDFVTSVALLWDGRAALSGSRDKTLMLWEVETGRLLRTLAEHTGSVWSFAFSSSRAGPPGRLPNVLSASYDRTLKLWDLGTGKVLRTFTGHLGPVYAAAFPPALDLTYALSSSEDRTLKLWEVATGKELRTFTPAPGLDLAHTALSVAFLPDGRTALSGGAEGELK